MGSTISDQGIKIITEALKASTQLKKLDFSGCDLVNQKISLLAEVLQLNTLTHLCLNANYIGTVGINTIIEALKENTTITHIDLKQNNIDQQSQIIVEKYLQRNKNIEEVNKAANKINAKVLSDTVINAKDKAIIKDTLKDIANNTKALNNATDMEKIIASMQELIIDKTTKLQLMTIENQLNDIIDSQADDISMLSGDSTFG